MTADAVTKISYQSPIIENEKLFSHNIAQVYKVAFKQMVCTVVCTGNSCIDNIDVHVGGGFGYLNKKKTLSKVSISKQKKVQLTSTPHNQAKDKNKNWISSPHFSTSKGLQLILHYSEQSSFNLMIASPPFTVAFKYDLKVLSRDRTNRNKLSKLHYPISSDVCGLYTVDTFKPAIN